jgi:hypothetical protein
MTFRDEIVQTFSQEGSLLLDVHTALHVAEHPIKTTDDLDRVQNLMDVGDEIVLRLDRQPKLANVLTIVADKLDAIHLSFPAWRRLSSKKTAVFTGLALAYALFENEESRRAAYENFEAQIGKYAGVCEEWDNACRISEYEQFKYMHRPFMLAKVARKAPPGALRDYCLTIPVPIWDHLLSEDILPAKDDMVSYAKKAIDAGGFASHVTGAFKQELLLLKLGDKIRVLPPEERIDVFFRLYPVSCMNAATLERFCWNGLNAAVLSLPEKEQQAAFERLRSMKERPKGMEQLLAYRRDGIRVTGWTTSGRRVPENDEIEAFVAAHPSSTTLCATAKPLSCHA